jgi:hypothetical protein
VRRTTTETAKDQKTSSRALAGEERCRATSVSTFSCGARRWRQKTAYCPRYPRQGGDQLLPCLRKAAQWLLATPLNMAWMVQCARGGCQLPPPTPVDRRRYPTKTKSTEESCLQLSTLLGRVWQPLPQEDKGKEDLGSIKGGGSLPLEGVDSTQFHSTPPGVGPGRSDPILRLLVGHAGSSTSGQLELCNQDLISLARCRVVNTRRQEVGALAHHEGPEPG